MKEALIYLEESGKLLPKRLFIYLFLCLTAGGILAPDTVLNLCPLWWKYSLNHWTTKEVPKEIIFEFRFRDGEELARQRKVRGVEWNLKQRGQYVQRLYLGKEHVRRNVKRPSGQSMEVGEPPEKRSERR